MKDIYEILKNLGIPYDIYEHQAVFTTKDAHLASPDIPGKQAKNLFLTNEKGTRHILVTMTQDKRADLAALASSLGEKRLRFASPERLLAHLGLTPGSVSPLGLINDTTKEVMLIVDADLLAQEKIYVHPNINTATVGISIDDFKKFLAATGHELAVMGK